MKRKSKQPPVAQEQPGTVKPINGASFRPPLQESKGGAPRTFDMGLVSERNALKEAIHREYEPDALAGLICANNLGVIGFFPVSQKDVDSDPMFGNPAYVSKITALLFSLAEKGHAKKTVVLFENQEQKAHMEHLLSKDISIADSGMQFLLCETGRKTAIPSNIVAELKKIVAGSSGVFVFGSGEAFRISEAPIGDVVKSTKMHEPVMFFMDNYITASLA